jgi:hypothetical protein
MNLSFSIAAKDELHRHEEILHRNEKISFFCEEGSSRISEDRNKIFFEKKKKGSYKNSEGSVFDKGVGSWNCGVPGMYKHGCPEHLTAVESIASHSPQTLATGAMIEAPRPNVLPYVEDVPVGTPIEAAPEESGAPDVGAEGEAIVLPIQQRLLLQVIVAGLTMHIDWCSHFVHNVYGHLVLGGHHL